MSAYILALQAEMATTMQKFILFMTFFLLGTTASLASSPQTLGVFGHWSTWTYSDKDGNHCFVYSSPTSKEPADLDHGPVTFFIRVTRHKAASTESSFEAGYDFTPGSPIRVAVDNSAFQMFSSKNSAWLNGGAKSEEAFLKAAERGHELTVASTSKRGNKTSYSFSLDGVTKAVARAQAACP
jgi:hypothetical protein